MSKRQKFQLTLYIIPLLVALLFYRGFFTGIGGILEFVWKFLLFFFFFFLGQPNRDLLQEAFDALSQREVLFFFLGWGAYWLMYRISLFIMAQFALPVTKWEERTKAYKRLVLFTQGKHGPAIFVKGGVRTSSQGELESSAPGVALVDSSSAVALVQHDDMKAISLPSLEEWQEAQAKTVNNKKKKGKSTLYEPKEPEIKGPGVVFTEQGQKIDDTVDLRRQTRGSDFLEVYTRDGIKVKSKVNVNFSLSDPPEKMWVGYLGGRELINLKILKVDQKSNDLIIKGGIPLDADDAAEILRKIELPSALNTTHPDSSVPYPFDPERVKWAVFHQARDKNGDLIPWHQTPLEAATATFRKIISDVPYDKFFNVDLFALTRHQAEADSGGKNGKEQKTEKEVADKTREQMFLSELKDEFALRVKARGLANFQFIEHLNGKSFSKDEKVSLDMLRQPPAVTLTGEKFNYFRHMGIVVKNASFGDVLACDEDVQKRMLEAWKAKMEREIAIFDAEYELKAIRVRNKNRALAQGEMTHLLSDIFRSVPYFDEALALRVLQALETSVADKEMSAADLQEILKSIHDWLLADQQDDENGGKKPPLAKEPS
jgi:hypothetical protein